MNTKELREHLRKKHGKAWDKAEKEVERDIAWNVGMLISKIRTKKGLTQAQLAKKIGTTQSGIARAESGYHISTQVLQKIADALNVTIKITYS